ncbi:MAG: hypothetical protein ABJF23_01605 [Bryobacteraceae bacterium]
MAFHDEFLPIVWDGEDPTMVAAGILCGNVAELLQIALVRPEPLWRIHATPANPVTVMAGLAFRLRGK